MAMALVTGSTAIAETTPGDESDAIKKTALDYIEGWYAGDAARMERALHSELAKRMVSTDATTGRSLLNQMSTMTLAADARGNRQEDTARSTTKRGHDSRSFQQRSRGQGRCLRLDRLSRGREV